MLDNDAFRALVSRVRAGDADAATELVAMCESTVHRVARIRMRRATPLRHGLDSLDVCQSVLKSFFVRSALGQYELDSPDDLFKLLAVMVRNKLIDEARRPQVRRRMHPSYESQSNASELWVDSQPDASRSVAGRDLLDEVRRRLTSEERYLVDQRVAGRPWAELAEELGASSEALRKRHARAIDRVAEQLGLDEVGLA